MSKLPEGIIAYSVQWDHHNTVRYPDPDNRGKFIAARYQPDHSRKLKHTVSITFEDGIDVIEVLDKVIQYLKD
jgi:hypothetical protein